MYSPSVIAASEEKILRDKPAIGRQYPDGIPAYSVDDSSAFTAGLLHFFDEEGTATRTLSDDESRFIAVTQLRCSFDFPYFAERFVTIDQSGYGLRPLYPLWESQRFVLQRMAALEDRRRREFYPDGLLLNILKARQLGVSTLAEALLAHRVCQVVSVRALAGADVESQAGYLFRMVTRLYEHLPWFLRPARTTFRADREMTFVNGSTLKTAWGKSTRGALVAVAGTEGSKGAIGRGQTYSGVHISELATWDNPEQLDTALFPAIPISPSTLTILESTAEHAGDWWHLHWQAAGEGIGRFQNIFIPWYAEPAKYALPPPVSWSPSTRTLEHAVKCETDSPRWFDGRTYTLTRAQLYWYESTRAYYERKGEVYKFFKEYPADDQECFQYAGKAIFSLEQLDQIDRAGSRRKLLDVWAVEPAREIATLRREAPEEESSSPAARIPPPLSLRIPAPRSPLAAETYPVPPGYGFRRLTPLQLAALPSLRHSVLSIWEYPRSRGRRRYVMATDVSDGLGQDYSVIDVIRQPTIEEPAEQVAQYVSNKVDAKSLASICDAIGRLYTDEDNIEALAAIEINNHGMSTQDTLQLHLGYGNFYLWEYVDSAAPDRRFSSRIGWVTSTRTRPMLLSYFYSAVTTFDPLTNLPDLVLNSPITRGELRHFVTEGDIGEAAAARGQHDDAVMAAAIGYLVAWRQAGGEQEPISERRARRAAREAEVEAAGIPRPDWRNSAVTSEEADRAFEDDDEFADDHLNPGDSGLFFSDRRDQA